VTVPRDYDADPGRFLSGTGCPHDDVNPYVAADMDLPMTLTMCGCVIHATRADR